MKWEDLLWVESGGTIQPEDLTWLPDARVQADAYLDQSPNEGLIRLTSGTKYLGLADSPYDHAISLNAGGVSSERDDLTFSWFSPYQAMFSTPGDPAQALYDSTIAPLLYPGTRREPATSVADVYFWDHLGAGPVTQLALAYRAADLIFKASNPLSYVLVPVGTDLLTESSKLRALRRGLNHLSDLHGLGAFSGKLIVVSSITSLSSMDAQNNMIRSTLSGVAAMVGGADWMALQPWNVFEKGYSDSDAATISRNVYHILSSEGFLDQTADPLAGSYTVESLTTSLSDAAWDLFEVYCEMSDTELSNQLQLRDLPADRIAHRDGGVPIKNSPERVVIGQTHYVVADQHDHDREMSSRQGSGSHAGHPLFPEILTPGPSLRITKHGALS